LSDVLFQIELLQVAGFANHSLVAYAPKLQRRSGGGWLLVWDSATFNLKYFLLSFVLNLPL